MISFNVSLSSNLLSVREFRNCFSSPSSKLLSLFHCPDVPKRRTEFLNRFSVSLTLLRVLGLFHILFKDSDFFISFRSIFNFILSPNIGIKGRSADKNIRVHEKCNNRVYIYLRISVNTTICENIQMTYLHWGPKYVNKIICYDTTGLFFSQWVLYGPKGSFSFVKVQQFEGISVASKWS
jgi:hypothetical protein